MQCDTADMRGTTALLFAILTAAVITLLLAFRLDQAYELPVHDALLRALPERPASATMLIEIDEASIRAIGPWPWPRTVLTVLVDRAIEGKARGVVIDVLLAESRDGDQQLARALQGTPNAAVAVLGENGEWVLPAASVHATPAHGNFELDHDGILRRVASTKQSRDRSLPAVSVAAASMYNERPIPVGVSLAPAFRTPARAIPRVSAATALREPLNVRGKIVFIGPTAFALGDRVLTPTAAHHQPDPGVTVHAAATESLVRGDLIRTMPPIVSGILAGAIAFALLPKQRRLLAIAILALLIVLAIALPNLAFPVITLLTITIIAQAAIEAMSTAKTLRQTRADREQEVESKRRLAHELKTPLASMRGLTQLLGQFDLSDDERRRVTTLLESEAGKLQSLVQVMLDLERLPLRDFPSTSSVIDLGAIVTKRIEFLRASTDRVLSVSAAPSVLVRADAALIERVIDNLIGNALKYTEDDVDVRVAKYDGAAMIEVEDHGPGIAPADRARVFERFVRGASAAGTHGLGLGLSMVAEIARWHRGDVALEDAVSGGALFRVTLPRTD